MSEVAWLILAATVVGTALIAAFALCAPEGRGSSNIEMLALRFVEWRKASLEADAKTAELRARASIMKERLERVAELHRACPGECATCQALKS